MSWFGPHDDLSHPVNLGLLAIVGAFALWEILGAFGVGPLRPLSTLSDYIWWFEDVTPWILGELVVGAGCVLLFTHLVFRWP